MQGLRCNAELSQVKYAQTATEPDPFGSDSRSPTGLVPNARKVLGGGCL